MSNDDPTENDTELDLDIDQTAEQIESKEVQDLKNELNEVIKPMDAPPMFPPHPVKCLNPHDYPESYNSNSKKEELVLQYVDNFKTQFQYIYPDRKTLFMAPYNECGIEKFVCTTIRPTILKFSKLYDWKECAQFVADYLQFRLLKEPTELPQILYSPTHTLKIQEGNCFDYSVLLASLLIGAGYDAYIVSGYATREVCNMDQSRIICPLLIKSMEKKTEVKRKEMGKYTVKPPKDMNSKYQASQESKAKKKLEEEALKRKLEYERYLAELERPAADPLYGLRVHAWVMVLSGKREVAETFFIETLTGNAVSTKDDEYLGIESVWNHKNYWVNMQSCIDGTAGLVFDLGDSSKWEYMLPSNDKPILLMPPTEGMEEEEESKDVEKHLDLPPSWVNQIDITLKDFERRCPEGKKVVFYKKCKVEKFAPYLLKDNMVLKITEYLDSEMKDLKQIIEEFVHRADKINKRVINFQTGWVLETFDRGRSKFLKEHRYQQSKAGPENERIMHFYHDSRVDGLKCREETPTEMCEHFENRPDFLYYRKVVFDKRQKKFGPQDGDNYRPILKIIERYNRNYKRKANDDIHELIYNIEAEKFQITYHRESTKIAPSTREFLKPPNWNDKSTTWNWNLDLHQTYQASNEYKQKKNVELYQFLSWLINEEEMVKSMVRKSEEEVKSILNDRTHEETVTEKTVSIYDTDRNEKAKQYKLDIEKKINEEKLRKQTHEVDYLAPFLAEKGLSDKQPISASAAADLKERCLSDLKQRLIDKANLIQKRYEAESNEMQKKQQWYQANQINMSREDEQEYLEYCSDALFRIHILELRLNRHKEKAPIKYQEMEQRLRADPRLSQLK
ncbi:dynein regulatory complex subunit 7 isoform X1 [Brachionus plicatilis]|uniref:Dynein regulatory complex subunit 7 n=1 Tax=Brachionus plicatilis TaxID=10195 RepID=A0A3M7T4Y1_BRAPC|nr:dynein regulatory complex subunit 7 isoform X1 [Brachionus plicatilis]